MSQQSIFEKSTVIRNETQPKANTRGRVADVLDDINETKANKEDVNSSISTINSDQLEQNNRLDTLESGVSGHDVLLQQFQNHINDQSNPHHVTKNQIGLGNVDNTADIDKPVSTATQNAINNLSNSTVSALANKVDKTTTTITAPDATFKYAYIFDTNNNVRRMLAGDLGKNVANSALTSVAGAGLTLGANWTLNTSGFYYNITGLSDSSNDSTVDMLLGQNSSGRIFKTNAKEVFKKLPNILTIAEKEQFGISWNNQYSNGSMNVYSITPTVIKNDHVVRYLVLQGLNLNVNPATTSVKFIPVGNSIGTGEIDCLGFQTFADGKSLIVSVYGDTLPADVQYNIVIRTTSPTIQTHRTTNSINVVTNINSIDVNNLAWQIKAYTAGQEGTVFTPNGALFAYSSSPDNKAYAYEPNQIVLSAKSDAIFAVNTNFYLEINFSLSNSGTTAVSDAYDFYAYLGLLQSSLPISLSDNSFLRIPMAAFRSGGYSSVVVWNNIVTNPNKIELSGGLLNANLVIMRTGNIYTQFLTVGSTTIIQSVTSTTEAVSVSLVVSNGTTKKNINGSIVQAFTF